MITGMADKAETAQISKRAVECFANKGAGLIDACGAGSVVTFHPSVQGDKPRELLEEERAMLMGIPVASGCRHVFFLRW